MGAEQLSFEQSSGRARRDSGALRALENAGAEWKDYALAVVQILAESREPFTAEDVRALAGDPPGHHNAMGALLLTASRKGIIRKVGYRKATRPSLHATELAEWAGV